MTRPLTITTTTHALAVAVYLAMTAFGLLHAAGIAVTRSLTELIGTAGVRVWAVALIVAPIGCLAAAVLTRRSRDPRRPLIAEAVCSLLVGVLFGLYWWALVSALGIAGAVATQILAAGFSLGSVGRTAQIVLELRRLKIARAHPVQADPAPAGDPTDRR